MLEDLRSLCRAVQAYEEREDSPTLTGFLEHARGLHARELTPGQDRRITVSTIHRAKGTEARVVILAGCEERLLPSWRRSRAPEQLQEERRLFYVACTRAKDRLYVTHARRSRRARDRGPVAFPDRGRAAGGRAVSAERHAAHRLRATSAAEALLVLALQERHAETLQRGELGQPQDTGRRTGTGQGPRCAGIGLEQRRRVAARNTASPRAERARQPVRSREPKEVIDMTEQNTNGPLDGAVPEHGTRGRARRSCPRRWCAAQPPAAETAPEATAAELAKRLELIHEVKRTAMREGVDYGPVPGTDKPGLFKPGAEKLAILFKLDVQPRNEPIWGPGEHLTVISRATVYHAPTGTRLGYGEGICSSRERNRAYRKRERACPDVRARPRCIKGKEEFGGGWVCWRKRDGCGAKFPDGDERIEGRRSGRSRTPTCPTPGTP